MRSIFGNNCAKGCLIYAVALVALLVVAAMGLDGLRARFGGAQVQGIKPPEFTIQSTGNSPPAATNNQPTNPAETAAGGGGGGGVATPTVGGGPPPPVGSPQPVGTAAPSQAQGGTITGEAGAAFYVVQPGDTLWGISQRFGVDLDALRALNNLSGDIIYPGQVLYLPTPNASQPAPSAPQTGTGGDGGESTDIPSMPNTGIVKKP